MNKVSSDYLNPVSLHDRIVSIDVLRGFAVLGILIMNIQSFSMPMAAYINPLAYGDLTGLNKIIWIVSHMIADEKFMGIFSMLFGAGILLFTDKAFSKGKRGGLLHYRRMMWLLVFGLIHAYLVWYGDILVAYSLCGMLAFVFHRKSPRTLIRISILFFIFPILMNLFFHYSIPYWPEESLKQTSQSWLPDHETNLKEITIMSSNWREQMELRASNSYFMETFVFLTEYFWRIMAMMLLGMALYKLRILSAERSVAFYSRMIALGLLLGYSLTGLGIFLNFKNGWDFTFSMFLGKNFNYVGSVGISLGYIGIVMLLYKASRFLNFKRVFAAVGKTAFSNYILMSIICTFLFNGHGLGLYGDVERKCQILIVFGIWCIILLISPIWLKYFRFGPLEWMWRSLTYWRRQPLRKSVKHQPMSTL